MIGVIKETFKYIKSTVSENDTWLQIEVNQPIEKAWNLNNNEQ